MTEITTPLAPPHEPNDIHPPGRFRRALFRIARSASWVVLFVGAAASGVLLHLDTTPARRLAARVVGGILRSSLAGEVRLGAIHSLGLTRLAVEGAAVFDPHGKQVLDLHGLKARYNAFAIASDFLFGKGDLKITIDSLSLAHADALTEQGPSTALTLLEAFGPREFGPPEPDDPRARKLRLTIGHIRLNSAWIHGEVAPPQAIDASVLDLQGSFALAPDGVSVMLEPTTLLERRMLKEPIALRAGGYVRTREDAITASGRVKGTVGAIALNLDATMDGDKVAATVEVPAIRPEGLAALVPNAPLTRPVAVKAHVEGVLPLLSAEVDLTELSTPSSHVAAFATVDVGAPLRAQIDITARSLDPHLFAPTAPSSSIDANVRADVELGQSGPRAVVDMYTEETTIAGQLVPALDAHAEFDRGVLNGTVQVHERGFPLEGNFAVTEAKAARFELLGEMDQFRDFARTRLPVDGRASLRVKGTFVDDKLDARIESTFAVSPGKAEVALANGSLDARVFGPLDALAVDASLDARDVSASGYDFKSVRARIAGGVTSPRVSTLLVDDERTIRAAATIDPKNAGARDIVIDIERPSEWARLAVGRIENSRGGVRIDGIDLRGKEIGTVKGSLLIDGAGIAGKLHGEALDLGRAADLVGAKVALGGLTNFDIDMKRGPKGSEGHIELELEDGTFDDLRGVSANLTATLHDEMLHADGIVRLVADKLSQDKPSDGCLGAVGSVKLVRGQARIHGPLLAAETWTDMRGGGAIAAEDVDLRCLVRRTPVTLPEALSDLGGLLNARVDIERSDHTRYASVKNFSIQTRNLALFGPTDPKTKAPTWDSKALDLDVTGTFDADTGEAFAGVALHDAQTLVDLSVSTKLDLEALLGDPVRRDEALKKMPFAGRLSVPRRKFNQFGTLPSMAHAMVPPMRGAVQFDVYAAGTLAEPKVVVRAIGTGLEPNANGATPGNAGGDAPHTTAVDVDTVAFYDGHKGRLDAYAFGNRFGREAELAAARVEAGVEWNAIVGEKPAKSPAWTGGLSARLSDLPLGIVPALSDYGVAGHIRGAVNVLDLGRHPIVGIDLSMPNLQVGPDLFFEHAKIALHTSPKKEGPDVATLAIDFLDYAGGRLQADASLGVRFQQGLVPVVDVKQSAGATVEAERFRLAVAQPFLGTSVSKFDGYIDGKIALNWAHLDEVQDADVKGDLRITQGVVSIPTIGQEFHDAKLTLVANPAGVLRIREITVEGTRGRLQGEAEVHLEGGTFRSAMARLEIPKGQALPLTVEGVPLGEARGQIQIQARNLEARRQIAVSVNIPDFNLELPQSIGRTAQPLELNEDIIVTPRLIPPEEKTQPNEEDAAGTTIVATIDLGDIQIQGKGIDVQLTDTPKTPLRIVVEEGTRVSGDIQILRGRVEVMGKVFEIQQGSLIHLRPEDVSNPYLNVTAAWDAPDGTRVYIDYKGDLEPISREKIRFRSDDNKPQQQLMSLLLFGPDYESGTVAGDIQTGPSQSTSQAVGGAAASLGASFASDQLNAILNNITPLQGFQVKLGTTDQGALQTSVGYKLGKNITATASFRGNGGTGPQQGQAALGGAANQNTLPTTQLGVEWRFTRNWLLQGSVGMGFAPTAGVDVLWRKSY